MTDIVERLRAQYDAWNNPPSPELPDGAGVTLDAAAEIERLRAALREIESITVHSGGDIHGVHPSFWEVAFNQAQDTARAALGGGDE